MIPLFHAEAVQRYKWMSDEEFADILALGNALPGPIATKMAGYIGYKVKGSLGSFIAIIAVSVPVLVIMIGLLGLIYKLKDSGIVEGMTQAIQPVIGVMMAVLAYDFYKKSWQGWVKSKTLFWTLLSFLTIFILNINPGIIIGIALAYGFLEATYLIKRKNKKNDMDRSASA